MLTVKDIEKFAKLARIDLTEAEKEKFLHEIDPILNYVNQINEISGKEVEKFAGSHRNIMRDDIIENETGKYTEAIIADMPKKKDNYLEVKKIIG